MNKNTIYLLLIYVLALPFSASADAAADKAAVLQALEGFDRKVLSVEAVGTLAENTTAAPSPAIGKKAAGTGSARPVKIIPALEFKDTDIKEALATLSQKSGLSIVMNPNVQGKVTVFLKEVDAFEALRTILESCQLAYIESEGIVRVMEEKDYEFKYGHKFGERPQTRMVYLSQGRASDLVPLLNEIKSPIGKVIADDKANKLILLDRPNKLEEMEDLAAQLDVAVATEVFSINYAKADEMAQKITPSLSKSLGHVKFDNLSNKLVVTDTPAKLKEISGLIEAFDEKLKEIFLETKIVQVELNEEHENGIDWEAIVSDYQKINLSQQRVDTPLPNLAEKLSVGTLTGDDFSILLEALDTVGKVTVLTSPRITAVNNRESVIMISSKEFPRDPSDGELDEEGQFPELGVKLIVTPQVHNDNTITLTIHPEVRYLQATPSNKEKNAAPIVKTSQAMTTVQIDNKATVVLGGLMNEERVNAQRKLFILGDLPFVGGVFRSQRSSVRKHEVIIFLTPKIVASSLDGTQVN